jgi:ubiquinone/menaquinone biosynthesis C-methylase UbiE
VINTACVPFSKEPEYLELNRQFVQSIVPHLRGIDCVVDLACGTGMLTELFLTELRPEMKADREQGPARPETVNTHGLTFFGIDISRESLKLARLRFTSLGALLWPAAEKPAEQEASAPAVMVFTEALADCLPLANAVANVVLLGNAIHCFTEKGKLIQEVYRVLRPAGVFAFNSSFYAGSIVAGTENFYEEWMKEALRYVKRREGEHRDRGTGGPLRKRGRGRPAFSNRWLTPAEYKQALDDHGFNVVSVAERSISMSRRHFEGSSASTGTWEAELASVLLSGYPVELASEALSMSVGPAFETVGVEQIPRSWLEVISVKR